MTRQLIVGMPESGKSTYIGALRHILVAMQVETELELTMLAGDEEHLNALEEKWLSCEPMRRTAPSNEAWVELNIRNRISSAQAVMMIPDLRGEHFERPLVVGDCPKDLHDALVHSDGILLFTNANREDDMLLIDDFGDMPDDDTEELPTITAAEHPLVDAVDDTINDDNDQASGRFRPEDMPEEVKIVEFLQMANRRPLNPKLRRIALVVSAWDLVGGEEGITPDTWLASKRPMLAQFLSHNSDLWQVRVYGISAQGGMLPERKAEFEKMLNQSERIRVVGHDAALHDLTAPLRWLMTQS